MISNSVAKSSQIKSSFVKGPAPCLDTIHSNLLGCGSHLYEIPSLSLKYVKESTSLRKLLVSTFVPSQSGKLEWFGCGAIDNSSRKEWILYRQPIQSSAAPTETIMKSWTVSQMISAYVLQEQVYVLHDNGSLSLLNMSLLELEKVYEPSSPLSVQVEYTKIEEKRTRLLIATRSSKTANELDIVIFHVLTKQLNTIRVPVSGEKALRLAVDPTLTHLCFSDKSLVHVYELSTPVANKKKSVQLSVEAHFLYLPHPDWLIVQSDKHTLSLWDLKFGTVQSTLANSDEESERKGEAILQATHTETEEYGHVLIASQRTSSVDSLSTPVPKKKKKSKTDIDPESQSAGTLTLQIYPFHLPDLGLSDVVGKRPADSFLSNLESKTALEEPVATILPGISSENLKDWISNSASLEKEDIQYITKLSHSASHSSATFTDVFCEWILCKVSDDVQRNTSQKSIKGKQLLSEALPCVALSQPSVFAFFSLIKNQQSKGFWPRRAVEYLLSNHYLSEQVCSDYLISLILEKKDWSLLVLALEEIPDLSPTSLERILNTIIDPSASSSFVRFASEYAQQIQTQYENIEPHSHLSFLAEKDRITNIQAFMLFKFFSCLGKGESDRVLYSVLKKLDVSKVLLVLDWTLLTLIPPAVTDEHTGDANGVNGDHMEVDPHEEEESKVHIRHYLWWLFTGANDSRFELKLQQWMTSLDVFMLLLDSHGSSLQFLEGVPSLLKEIRTYIHRSISLFESYDTSLRGPLSILYPKSTSSVSVGGRPRASSKAMEGVEASQVQELKKSHGKRWKSMLKQIQDGVGDYALEVIDL